MQPDWRLVTAITGEDLARLVAPYLIRRISIVQTLKYPIFNLYPLYLCINFRIRSIGKGKIIVWLSWEEILTSDWMYRSSMAVGFSDN